ncbi:hypothetical protein C6W26_12130 [Bacillus halotolerans]|nr:hypothetical protein C6W26_12130 [Bacillus halotolerans]
MIKTFNLRSLENLRDLFYFAKKSSLPTTCEFDKQALLKQSKKPLRSKGLSYDSDWARTSDLYPVKDETRILTNL